LGGWHWRREGGANGLEPTPLLPTAWVQLYAHGGLELPPTNTVHALNLRYFLGEDGISHVVDLRLGHHVGGEGEDEDGLRRDCLTVAWILRK